MKTEQKMKTEQAERLLVELMASVKAGELDQAIQRLIHAVETKGGKQFQYFTIANPRPGINEKFSVRMKDGWFGNSLTMTNFATRGGAENYADKMDKAIDHLIEHLCEGCEHHKKDCAIKGEG